MRSRLTYAASGARATSEWKRTRLDRLTSLDLSTLKVEDRGAPMHVAGLLILDRIPGATTAGLPGLPALSAFIAIRLASLPRLRQVLYCPPLGLGLPMWTDYQGFDIREHVRARAVASPADEAALLRTCAELNERPLDRSRPLWQIWLLTGLADDHAAVLIRLHHVIADGIAALGLLAALLGPSPIGPAACPRLAQKPSYRELAADQLAGAWRLLRRALRPAAASAKTRQIGGQAAALLREGRAPRLSLNAQVTLHRQLALLRADLELARDAAHAHGGTVNDVVLASVAGGARALLAARGELGPATVLKASVAVALRRTSDQVAGGNRVGMMIAPLPAGEADASRCLARIVAATAQRKARPPYVPGSRLLQAWLMRAMPRQRLVNVFVSNLHGPARPQSLGGARVLEMFQLGVVQGNVPVSVGALSYAGQLTLAIVADARIPDLHVFAAGMAAVLRDLGALPRSSALQSAAVVESSWRASRGSRDGRTGRA
jgi:diacylglycerol O-acyltransferase / wax synthase